MKKISIILFVLALVLSSCRKDPQVITENLDYEPYVGNYKITSMNTNYSNFSETPIHNGVNRLFNYEGNAGTDRYAIRQYIVDEDHSFETGWRDTISKVVEIIQAEIVLKENRLYEYTLITRSEFEGGEHVEQGKSFETYDEYKEEGAWNYIPELGFLKFKPYSGTEINRYERTDLESGLIDLSMVIVEENIREVQSYSWKNMLNGEGSSSNGIGKIIQPYILDFSEVENGFSVRNYSNPAYEGDYRLSELGLGEMNEFWKIKTEMILERQ
jgi:hypothetical protein